MTASKTLMGIVVSVLIIGCGGPGENAEVPQAQPAEETSTDIGDHTVHFSAQSTDQLPPDIARIYSIVRSKNRAMLTVSIIHDETSRSVPAEVTVKTQNLTGQLKTVTMREIREPGETEAIYYIGETPVANRETLIFDISVIPEGKTNASSLRFKRQFYSD